MNAATAARIADIYARTLMDLAQESGMVEAVSDDLEAISSVLAQELDLQPFLASPYFAEETRRDLMRRVFSGKVNQLTLHFVLVMVEHDRGGLLSRSIDRFRRLYRAYQGYEPVTATVAQGLSDEQTNKLARDLAEAMKIKIDLDVQVDPSLLGGIVIRHGDKLLDNSIRGRLTRTVSRITSTEKRYKK
ncbi:MAG: ATP synthase F1 subunit delta [Planctomycetes bacterium RBG_13_62_9]|nr:MAG: ATP synthase F1 subunit delta [Planctomycetes bacterium RBG_13_62_9]